MISVKLNKNKSCKNCGCKFEQIRRLQYVCSTNCAYAYSKKLIEKKEKKAWNIEKRERLDKLKTLTEWKKDLEKEINAIVRLIDKGHNCMMCDIKMDKRINACHYASVGSNDTLRFNLLNIWSGCHKCNSELGGNLHGFDLRIIETQGRKRWEYIKFELPQKFTYLGLIIPEIKDLIIIAREIKKQLQKIDMPYTNSNRWKLRESYNKRLNIYK